MQPELDGTPCHVAPSLHHNTKVATSLHHETEVGTCRRAVCTIKVRPPVLKRKKRFVCLVTLAALLKAKRERRKLKEQMEYLRRLALYNSIRGAHRVTGSGYGNAVYPNTRRGGTGSVGSNGAARDEIEIHILPGRDNGGIGAVIPGTEISPPFISGTGAGGTIVNADIRRGLPGSVGGVTSGGRRSSGVYRNRGNEGIGAPGMEDTNAGRSGIGGRIGMDGVGFVGGSGSVSEVGGGGNFGLGNSRLGGSLGGNSALAAGILGAGITSRGVRNLDGGSTSRASVSSVTATTSRRTGGGGSATVVGVVGSRTSTSGSGIGANGGSRGLGYEGGDTTTSESIGVGGGFTNSGTRNSHSLNVGAVAIGATSGGSRSGAPGIGGVSRALSGAVGSASAGNAAGSTGRAGGTRLFSGDGFGADTYRARYFGPGVYDSGSLNSDVIDNDDAEEG